ncbi:MAG: hypothetical protein ACK5LL_09555 [Suipraeoptans sp.]
MQLYFKKNVLPIILCLSFVLTGCADKFDAVSYTEAILDLSFQGDITNAKKQEPDESEEALLSLYYDFISNFVTTNITNELGLDETKEAQFQVLIAKIFQTMRYSVEDSNKTDKKEYEVTVKIWPTDTFVNFMDYIREDAKKIEDKRASGGYTGTEDEIKEQIMQDIATHAYELMDVAYSESTYSEPVKVKLVVSANEDNEYSIDSSDMHNLIVKMLRLDELS